jgi:hypothetical protein
MHVKISAKWDEKFQYKRRFQGLAEMSMYLKSFV